MGWSFGTYCGVKVDLHPSKCHCEPTSLRLHHTPILRSEWKHSNVACVTWDVAASLILAEGLTDTLAFPRLYGLLFISRNFLWCIKCLLRVCRRGVQQETKECAIKSEWKWKGCLWIMRTDSWAPREKFPKHRPASTCIWVYMTVWGKKMLRYFSSSFFFHLIKIVFPSDVRVTCR